MRHGVVRSLVLACSLPLALPQGWCCLFAAQVAKPPTTAAKQAATAAPVKTDGCCPRCRHNTDANPKPDHQPPRDHKPSAPPKCICSCSDRDATLPSKAAVEPGVTGLVLFVPPLDSVAPSVAPTEHVVGSPHAPPGPQLHVIKCVWLC
jgi:hypothetical protein